MDSLTPPLSVSSPSRSASERLLDSIDAAYQDRDNPSAHAAGQRLLTQELNRTPDDYELLWRAARVKYWDADGVDHDVMAKRLFGKQGMTLGERAILANAQRVEGHCFYAVSTGMYAGAVGILRAVAEGLDRKFAEHIDVARSVDPAFADAMPRVGKGRYYAELPWPKRDLRKSKAELAQALSDCPHALRAHLYLAEALLKDGDRAQATAELLMVQRGSVHYDPPEGNRVKARAKALLATLGRF